MDTSIKPILCPRKSGPTHRFLEEYVPVHCKPSTREEYSRSVRLFVDPVIGELRVPEVQRKDIAALHHGLRDKPYQANRTLGVLSKMFNLADLWDLRPDGSNPCRHVKRFREEKRERFLSDIEYQRLGAALKDMGLIYLTPDALGPNLLPRNAKGVSIMDFGSKLGHFLLFVLLTIITLGLYLLWFHVTMTQERNKLLKEIRDSLKGR